MKQLKYKKLEINNYDYYEYFVDDNKIKILKEIELEGHKWKIESRKVDVRNIGIFIHHYMVFENNMKYDLQNILEKCTEHNIIIYAIDYEFY